MITVYRFSHFKFADDISGIGAKLKGGRWNNIGTNALYTSEHISLSLLELLVNASTLEQLQTMKLMEIIFPASATITEVKLEQLKKNWKHDINYCQWLGNEMLKSNDSLIIKVPSSVVENEHNYIINPAHKLFNKVTLKNTTFYDFDERLFKV